MTTLIRTRVYVSVAGSANTILEFAELSSGKLYFRQTNKTSDGEFYFDTGTHFTLKFTNLDDDLPVHLRLVDSSYNNLDNINPDNLDPVQPPEPTPEPPPVQPPAQKYWYGAGGGPYADTSGCFAAAKADFLATNPHFLSDSIREKFGTGWDRSSDSFTMVIEGRVSMSLDYSNQSYQFTRS